MSKFRYLKDHEKSTISTALKDLAKSYDNQQRICTINSHHRMADQFELAAADARKLADLFDQYPDVEIDWSDC